MATALDRHRDILAAVADPGADAALLVELVATARHGREALDTRIAAALGAAGCDVEAFSYNPADVPLVDEFAAPGATPAGEERCLVGTLAGRGEGPRLLLFAHPDTEPFAADPRWTGDPYAARQENGRIAGWGVADDLAGIATMVRVCALLRSAGLAHGDIIVVSAPSKGHRRGIAAALARGVSADAAVYCHPAESGRGLNEIKAFAPGQLEFSIEIEGRVPETNEPAHSAFAHTGLNPMDRARCVLDALAKLDATRGKTVTHPRLQHAIGRSTNIMVSSCRFGAAAPLSRMPSQLTLGGAMTLIPGEDLSAIRAEVTRAVRKAVHGDGGPRPAISWISGVSAAETEDDAPLARLAHAALACVGAKPAVNPLHTSSDIRNPIVQAGIPTVGFGPLCGNLTMAGGANEWVDSADFSRAILATATLAVSYDAV